ncbi:MAG TPA: type II secretion system protein GspM [Candidatus Binataceae bacterium]|nr:type II secretion system protein GspM [Candidatus Binataceae bacterium]
MAPKFRALLEKAQSAASERMRAPAMRRFFARLESVVSHEAARVTRLSAPAWSVSRAWYSKREPREKLLLRVFGAILGVVVFYNFIFTPIAGLGGGFGDRVAARERQLVQVRSMMRSYNRLKVELAATEKRTVPSKDFSLFSVIEQSLTKTVGRDKIGSITPSDHPVPGGYQQYTIDLKLAGLNLAQIVDVLYGVQTLPMPVTVSNLHVRQRDKDTHSYDVDMTCMALGRNG